ncbi:MAG: hypothetical protein ACO3IL_05355 [Steroidobacteraceae bacterium]
MIRDVSTCLLTKALHASVQGVVQALGLRLPVLSQAGRRGLPVGV